MSSLCLLSIIGWLFVAPDVIPDNHRAIEHQLVLEWDTAQFPESFFAFPTAGFGGSIQIEPGVPFDFSSKYDTKIYALPSGMPFKAPGPPKSESSWPRGSIPVAQISTVRMISPLKRVETRLRVTAVGIEVQLEVIDETRRMHILPYAGISVIGAGGLALLVRRRRRSRRLQTP